MASYSFKVHFISILLPIPRFSKWVHSLKSPLHNPICTSTSPHTCYMPCPSQSSWFFHPNDIWWWAETVRLLLQSPPLTCHPVPLRAKHPSQHLILLLPSTYDPPTMWKTKFHTHKKSQNNSSEGLNLYIFWEANGEKKKRFLSEFICSFLPKRKSCIITSWKMWLNFKVMSRNLHGGTEKKHENTETGQCLCWNSNPNINPKLHLFSQFTRGFVSESLLAVPSSDIFPSSSHVSLRYSNPYGNVTQFPQFLWDVQWCSRGKQFPVYKIVRDFSGSWQYPLQFFWKIVVVWDMVSSRLRFGAVGVKIRD